MASSQLFTCNQCGFNVESWSDGNPYVIGANGKRLFYYHPGGSERLRQIALDLYGFEPTPDDITKMCSERGGNAPDYICTHCGKVRRLDKNRDKFFCRSCKGSELIETWTLAGKKCMKCGGVFSEGVISAIS